MPSGGSWGSGEGQPGALSGAPTLSWAPTLFGAPARPCIGGHVLPQMELVPLHVLAELDQLLDRVGVVVIYPLVVKMRLQPIEHEGISYDQ